MIHLNIGSNFPLDVSAQSIKCVSDATKIHLLTIILRTLIIFVCFSHDLDKSEFDFSIVVMVIFDSSLTRKIWNQKKLCHHQFKSEILMIF